MGLFKRKKKASRSTCTLVRDERKKVMAETLEFLDKLVESAATKKIEVA